MATVIAEGKTKRIERLGDKMRGLVRIENLNDTTAGDGARHEVIEGKAELSTLTSANMCKLLQECGFPVAYGWTLDKTSFVAPELTMIPLEVVTRGIEWGSYLERNKKAKQGRPLSEPVVEFFLKTKGKKWTGGKGDYDLVCDDPYMEITEKDVFLYDAHSPLIKGTYFVRLSLEEALPVPGTQEVLSAIAAISRAVYETLRYAWACVGELAGAEILFVDMKLEYGFDSDGRLMIGDVIDAESCRLLVNGEHASKQGFREGASADLTKLQLGRAADLSNRLRDVSAKVKRWTLDRYQTRSIPAYPGLLRK